MHLPFPQDLHDFVWLEARDFRPALFTGQGQESSQFAASTLRRKFQRQHTSRQALRVSGRTLAKTRAQRKLALPRVAQPQRPLASEVFFRAAFAPTARCSAGRQRRLIFKFARHPAPGSASTQHRDVMTLTVCINAQGLVYLQDEDDRVIDLLADEYVARGDAAHGQDDGTTLFVVSDSECQGDKGIRATCCSVDQLVIYGGQHCVDWVSQSNTDYAMLQRQFPDIGGRDGGAVKLLQVLACCQGTVETLNYRGTLVGDHADYVRGGEDDVRSEDDDIIDDQSDGCLDDY